VYASNSAAHAEGLGRRIWDSLAHSQSRLMLDLNKLQWDKVDNPRPLCESLAAYRSRTRVNRDETMRWPALLNEKIHA
jgi:hypothetical protein